MSDGRRCRGDELAPRGSAADGGTDEEGGGACAEWEASGAVKGDS